MKIKFYHNKAGLLEHENRMMFLRNFLPTYMNGKLLDIGCYKCSLASFLSNTVDYYGLDLDVFTNKKLKIKKHDLNKNVKIPFPDKYFDYIVCSGILEHLFSPERTIMEMRRMLKDDGIIIISLPNEKNLHLRIHSIMGKEPFNMEEQKDPLKKHFWIFTPKIAKEWISKYFDIVETKSYIGLFGSRFIPSFLANLYPNLFCSDYFMKCIKQNSRQFL
jgi:SAM-dependent methyltransferase